MRTEHKLPQEIQKKHKSNMKKYTYLITFLSIILLTLTSCLKSDGALEVKEYPYAVLRSVSIDDIHTKYTIKGSDGNDSTITKKVIGSNYPFTIDQENNIAYNVDSLPVGTDVTRVSTYISCDGIAYLYVDSLDSFKSQVSTDSLDFTNPLRLRIVSTDKSYSREYQIRLNVHTIDPDQLYWNKLSTTPDATSSELRLIAAKEALYLFGTDTEGKLSLATAAQADASAWTVQSTTAPTALNLNSITLFNDNFYAVAEGKLYTSADGATWENLPCEKSLTTLFAASDKDNIMWAATTDSLATTADPAAGFTAVQPLSKRFPLNNLSWTIAPLRTNMNINRYILIGGTPQEPQQPKLWGKLSNEKKWVEYHPSSYQNKLCPELKSLTIIPYDSKLYAIGGSGTVEGKRVEALSTIFISRDNGLTWEAAKEGGPTLPAELSGTEIPFSATVDQNGNIWLATGGSNGTVWRGRMNKLDL